MKTLAIITLLIGGITINAQSQFTFPELGYSYDALEVFVDKTTMEIHYTRHHKAYFNNFVKAADELKLNGMAMEAIFNQVSQYPVTIRNNGGGYFNHKLFWEVMSPAGGGNPSPKLMKAIKKDFGSFEIFKNEFEDAAKGQFGSGWAWLSVDKQGNLFVSNTPNQDNPLMDVVEKRGIPILALDVWEHAYYLHYQNKRGDYVGNFWKVVDWKEVEKKYNEANKK
ncbi:MAG: superoxide dismutase [Bacteroidales bacterium]|nr:superoxide dismutase [Bacteroidales bacterium]MDD3891386.1 superoxide dismutase [Bacteroidales bacterium]